MHLSKSIFKSLNSVEQKQLSNEANWSWFFEELVEDIENFLIKHLLAFILIIIKNEQYRISEDSFVNLL
jgi:hypothetical protein